MSNKIYTVAEAVKFFNDVKPKFVSLRNNAGKVEVPYNTPGQKSLTRFQQIANLLNKKGLPDGIYLLCYRESIQPTASEYTIAIGKGNYNKAIAEAAPAQPPVVVQAVSEQVWTAKEAVQEIGERLNAENNVKWLQLENERLKEQLASKELAEPKNETAFAETVKQMFESFSPAIDKYFDIQDKKIRLETAKLNYNRANQMSGKASVNENGLTGKAAVNDLREDGGISFDSPKYEQYFAAMCEQADDDEFENELQQLEAASPQLYKFLCNKYEIEIEDNGEPTTGN